MQSHIILKEGGRGRRHTLKEGDVKTEAETGVMQPQTENVHSPQQLEAARNWFSAGASRRSTALPAPSFQPLGTEFQTSGLQNCEGIRFCCFKPQSLW